MTILLRVMTRDSQRFRMKCLTQCLTQWKTGTKAEDDRNDRNDLGDQRRLDELGDAYNSQGTLWALGDVKRTPCDHKDPRGLKENVV